MNGIQIFKNYMQYKVYTNYIFSIFYQIKDYSENTSRFFWSILESYFNFEEHIIIHSLVIRNNRINMDNYRRK